MPTNSHTLVIAEAGVNHNGDIGLARQLIDAAAAAGADFVKFQTFTATEIATDDVGMADYQKAATGRNESQLAMLQRLELDAAAHEVLLDHCRGAGIALLSTPFDLGSLRLLTGRLALPTIKIGSGDLDNGPLVHAAACSGRRIILSTGMASLGEIEDSLALIALALSDPKAVPTRLALRTAWANPAARARVSEQVVLLHCISDYPAAVDSLNLAVMDTLRQAFGIPVGYSDHSLGPTAAIAAVARGAVAIEKHLTLDRTMEGPDHRASLEPAEMTAMIAAVREVEVMVGSPVKAIGAAERNTATVARKVVVAARPIAAGTTLTEADIAVKRAGGGVSPMRYWSMIGATADRGYRPGEVIGVVL